MGIYANIGGGQKQLTSLYANINGSSKKLSYVYANVYGLKKDILSVLYRWKKIYASAWESTYSTGYGCTFTYSTTDYRVCDTCGNIHSYIGGRFAFSGCYVYKSVTYNKSNGTFTGSGAQYINSVDDSNADNYKGLWYLYSDHLALKLGSYSSGEEFQCADSTYTSGEGYEIDTYYYAVPTSYENGSYEILSSSYRYDHRFAYSTGEMYSGIDYDPNDGSNNDNIKHYDGYKCEYLGQQ